MTEPWPFRHFKPEEFADPSDFDGLLTLEDRVRFGLFMSRGFVSKLDDMRERLGRVINIHSGYAEKGHSTYSRHYRGLAGDLDIDGLNVVDQFLEALKHDFDSYGIYTWWNTPGLHLDVLKGSPLDKFWWSPKRGLYLPLSYVNFQTMLSKIDR